MQSAGFSPFRVLKTDSIGLEFLVWSCRVREFCRGACEENLGDRSIFPRARRVTGGRLGEADSGFGVLEPLTSRAGLFDWSYMINGRKHCRTPSAAGFSTISAVFSIFSSAGAKSQVFKLGVVSRRLHQSSGRLAEDWRSLPPDTGGRAASNVQTHPYPNLGTVLNVLPKSCIILVLRGCDRLCFLTHDNLRSALG